MCVIKAGDTVEVVEPYGKPFPRGFRFRVDHVHGGYLYRYPEGHPLQYQNLRADRVKRVGREESPTEAAGSPMVLRGDKIDTELTTKAEKPATGRKDDSGKLDFTLLEDMPRALAAVVEVMQWAVTEKKPVPYTRGSWLWVSAQRYRAAVHRHLNAAALQRSRGEQDLDDETKLLHLAHAATSALMALENELRAQEESNGTEVQA